MSITNKKFALECTIWGNILDDTGWSKATVTNNISLMSLKIAKNGLTQWFLESFYAAVLVFWCPIMIRWTKSFISLFCQNGGLASARLNPAWTEPSNNPQRLPSSFDIVKYHPNTPRLSLRLPKTPPNSIRHYRHHRTSSKTFKVVYLVHQYMRSWMKVEPSHHFSTTVKWKIWFSWSLWDIKIPKQPHKSFLKIIGLGHFS